MFNGKSKLAMLKPCICSQNLISSCLVGPALVTTKDAGDAVTLLQSLAGSTFDSSQLVLTACMGYQNINETRLQQLRNKHRPAVIASVEERSKGLKAWKDSQGLASKLADMQVLGNLSRTESGSTNADEILISLTGEGEIDSVPDLQEQVDFVFPFDPSHFLSDCYIVDGAFFAIFSHI